MRVFRRSSYFISRLLDLFVLRGKKEPEIGGLGEHLETCSRLIQVFSHHHHRFGLDQSGEQVDQHWHPQLEIEVTNEQNPSTSKSNVSQNE